MSKFISKNILAFIIIAVIFGLSFVLLLDTDPRIDETVHYPQIAKFMVGDFTLMPSLSTIPGFHAFMAVIGKVIGLPTLVSNDNLIPFRLICTLISLASVFVFFLIARKIDEKNALIKIGQYAFLPIMFCFLFLVYTDMFSMILILLAFFCIEKKKYPLAGLLGFFSILVRQNNIIWLAFLLLYAYVEVYGYKINTDSIKKFLRKTWIFLLGFLFFIVFFILNKGVAIHDAVAHPIVLMPGNIYFMLFLFFFIFLPLNISNFSKVIDVLKNKKVILISVLFYIYFLISFQNTHPYNQVDYVLNTHVLKLFTSTILLKSLFFIPVLYSILSLYVTKLHKKSYYLLYAFSFIFLLPSWLIAIRYYFVPFVFFILFKKEQSKLVEYSTIAICLVSSAILLYGVSRGWFFV